VTRGEVEVRLFRVGGVEVPYRVERRNVKNTRLEFRKGELWVVLGRWERDEGGILRDKQEWVVKNHLRIQEALSESGKWHGDGEVMVGGEVFRLVKGGWVKKAEVREGERIIRFNPAGRGHRTGVKNGLKRMLVRKVNEWVEEFGERLGQKPEMIRIKNQRTAWGSCSSRRNLNLNLRLVFLPDKLARYVVFHEMLHLRYMSHGKRFKAVMEKEFPGWQGLEKELARWWYYVQKGAPEGLLELKST